MILRDVYEMRDRQAALLEQCDHLDATAAAGVGTLTTSEVRRILTGEGA